MDIDHTFANQLFGSEAKCAATFRQSQAPQGKRLEVLGELGFGLFTPHSPQYAPQKYYDAYLDGLLNGNIDNLELPSYWKDGSTNPLPDLDDVAVRERRKETFVYQRFTLGR